MPGVEVDLVRRQLRLECEVVKADYALEFLVVSAGTNEYEAVLKSRALASHLHAGLLMLGLEVGHTIRQNPQTGKWELPNGPRLKLTAQWEDAGGWVCVPANRLLRGVRTRKEAPPMTWVFAGSRLVAGRYMADVTGYLVSVVNVDGAVLDLSDRASSAMEDREWEPNGGLLPRPGTRVWLVIEPDGVGAK
jgi:hypothetical protein